MKKIALEFVRRGLVSCGFGPLVLAVLYLILQKQGIVEYLTVNQVCLGIFSLFVLAFVAGGMNVLYQLERLPLMVAIFIHGSVLYCSYLVTYLINGWLQWGIAPILTFSGIFAIGYLGIWAVIYSAIKRKTAKINRMLQKKRQTEEL